MPVVIIAGLALTGMSIFGAKDLIDSLTDTTDRVLPTLMVAAGGAAMVAASIMIVRSR